ncbi:MAG: hypothetical protein CL799_06155, partial [Chromatiales bacterium]|nr:hypothetical protein [Chromatiales bacterium]
TDLCCWANVLNVIDEILENQLKLSEKMDIKFVVDCLHLTEVILSNTTASYGSYQSLDRLGDLLDVDDLDVLEATLRVLATYLLSSEKNSVFGSDKAERKKIAKQLTPFLNIWEGKLSTLLSVDCDISIESNSNLFF